MHVEESLWDANKTAEVLHVRAGTIYDWASKGILPHVVLNRGPRRSCIRFRPSDIREFINARTRVPNQMGKAR